MAPRLSKSRFVTGWQCPKLLWWTVHEPRAAELVVDVVMQDRFDQGAQVGALAREQFPGGVLIDLPHDDPGRVAATRAAMAAGAPAIFEATFIEGGVYVAVDVLLREPAGWVLIEVKSSSRQKPEHIPDAAIQTWVLYQAGVTLTRVEIMHLEPAYRHGRAGDLLARTDVTAEVIGWMPQVPGMVAEFRAALAGPLPERTIGEQCGRPRACPFVGRCWPDDRDHIHHLAGVSFKGAQSWMQQGVHRLADIPADARLNPIQHRQVAAHRAGALRVAPGLAAALVPLRVARLGVLDFEAINRAVPVWDGQKPWEQTAVQFSYHERRPDGTYRHADFLAEGPDDPRAEIADRLLAATADAERIVVYTHYEKGRIEALADQLPARRDELLALVPRLFDLHPVVRHHVAHPDFRGSFSLKRILTPLCPDLSYDDLVIMDGMRASAEIARLLFFVHLVQDRAATRRNLLEYCKRDTWATVRMVEALQRLGA